jgi:hypothetical protein
MFKEFFLSLDASKREKLAEDAGTTVGYIRTHLIAPPGRRRTPNKALMHGLVLACKTAGAAFGEAELLRYFYEIDAGDEAA